MSVNKVILLGNVGQDPEVRYLESGTCMARVSLATNEFFQNRAGERQERTEWHRVVFWGRQAETIEKYVRKGERLYVEGRLATRSWEDKDNGMRYITEIVAITFQFLGQSPQRVEGATPAERSMPAEAPPNPIVPDPVGGGAMPVGELPDDLPF